MKKKIRVYLTVDLEVFEKDLDKTFGENKWELYLEYACDLCDERLFPDSLNIEVLDVETGDKIGEITVGIKKYVEDYGYGAFIEVEPDKLLNIKKGN